MKDAIKVTGMVLAANPIGEYDRRVVILTKERGKISAFARGARKINGSSLMAVNPFVYGTFMLYEGRNSYSLLQAEISNYFQELREDVHLAYYGFYFLEMADYYTREGNDEGPMLALLYQSLRALLHPGIDNRLVKVVMEWKAYQINGVAPYVYACMECGATEGPFYFDAARGGIYCSQCNKALPSSMKLLQSTLYTLQFIQATPVEKLYTFRVSKEVLSQLELIAKNYSRYHRDKRFKSLEILETLEKND